MKHSPERAFAIWLRCAVGDAGGGTESCSTSPLGPVRYIVSLARRPEHLVRVKILLGAGASQRDVQLPVWNALYQVRDFSST